MKQPLHVVEHHTIHLNYMLCQDKDIGHKLVLTSDIQRLIVEVQ